MIKKMMFAIGLNIIFMPISFSALIECPKHLPLDVLNKTHWKGWIVNKNQKNEKLTSKNTLINSSILAGESGEENKPSPATLAPGKETKRGNQIIESEFFSKGDYPILLICKYSHTNIYLSQVLPKGISNCEQTYELVNPDSEIPGGVLIKGTRCF